jgi:histone-lysine N-methyltransferase ASH1L
MESSDPMRVDHWSPPMLATSPSPPFDTSFDSPPQPSSDAASSTTTSSTPITTSNPSESEEAGSSSRTTPAISEVSEDLNKNQDDEVSKQIVTEAAQVRNATPAVVADHQDLQTTRRRSSRLSAVKTPAATSTTKASTTSGAAPATPHPRTNASDNASSSSAAAGSASRALRSSARKEGPRTNSATRDTEQPQEETGRPRRQSAINALVKLIETPRNAKRSHEAMDAGSKSADPKIPGGSIKKAKLDEGSSATSSPQPSEVSQTPSEEPPRPKKRRKVWINQGLYVGQDDEDDRTLNMRPATKTKKGKKSQAPRRNAFPTPIFRGKEIMNKVRDFTLPFHVFAPLPIKPPTPKDWRKLNQSRHSRSYTVAFYTH